MKKRVRAGEIPTASMADIAFLLLIFFLVTTTIDMDKGLGLVLPPKGEEKEIPKRNISNILINARGDILLDKEPIQMRDIRQVVREKNGSKRQTDFFSKKRIPKLSIKHMLAYWIS